MTSLLSLAGIALIAFVSTNIDDLMILVALFTGGRVDRWSIIGGQVAGMAAIVLMSLLGSLFALGVPGRWIGLLGLLPIGLGILRLRRCGRFPPPPTPASARSLAAIAATVTASGGDNVSLYVPLFSVHSGLDVAFLCAAFMALSVLWCVLAWAVAGARSHGLLRRWFEHQAEDSRIVGVVMIGLGAYILIKSDSASLFGQVLAR